MMRPYTIPETWGTGVGGKGGMRDKRVGGRRDRGEFI